MKVNNPAEMANVDLATVAGFGREWFAYSQKALPQSDADKMAADYFSLVDFSGEGFDLGCGSGRWAKFIAPKVRLLHCIDPSDAIYIAMDNLRAFRNVEFHNTSADDIPLEDGSQDFGYCLGVLHHIPDPQSALNKAVAKLKPGGQFLLYVYYRFENRPLWFRTLWRVTDIARRVISRLPFRIRQGVTILIAASVYWPLARIARSDRWPLAWYRDKSFYTMRTDALDRFGTRLEQRFTKDEIRSMMERAGLTEIRFSDHAPYWVATGVKSRAARERSERL